MDTSSRKILFFDVDGTLITNDDKKILPQSTTQAINLAKQKGHLTFVNSGRVFCNIYDDIKSVGFDGYVCGCGTYIFAKGKEIFHNKLSREVCMDMVETCSLYKMKALYEHTNHVAYDGKVGLGDAYYLIEYFQSMGTPIIDDVFDSKFIFDKFVAAYDDKSQLEEFKRYASAKFDCIQRERDFLEVVPKGYSKATGIEFLLNYYDIPISNAYAFGDSNNDLDMLKYVPNSIAMRDSSEEVLEVSGYVTDSVINDGIFKAMKHLGII